MLKNVTITLDEDTLRRARIRAAQEGTSVSKLVSRMLDRELRQSDAYRQAFERWKKTKPFLEGPIEKIDREKLHERGQ